jgi:hypothetical protein
MKTFIIIAIIVIAIWIFAKYIGSQKKLKNQRFAEQVQIARQMQQAFDKIMKVKTTQAKINNCSKALDLMDMLLTYPEAREVVTNIDELRLRVIKIKKVLPVVDYVEKANKHRFKKKDKSELNCLLDTLYGIKTNNIRDEDFIIADVVPGDTGEKVTVPQIRARAKELGWEEE